MPDNKNGWTPELERAAMDALAMAKAEWDDGFPDFSIGEALKTYPDNITPEVFHKIASDEMRKVYDCDLSLGEDLEIPSERPLPEDYSLQVDVMWLTERNLRLMEKYLRDQIAKQADPERIREDLITLDRYLNIWLRSECLDPEDAEEELADYFVEYLLKQDPLPPFTPQFGTLGRFYTWLKDEPAVQNHLNYNEVPTPHMCQVLLINLRRNIPLLTRMYEVATDPANDRPEPKTRSRKGKRAGRVSGKPKLDRKPKMSTAEKRVENWRLDQMARNRAVFSQVRRVLLDNFDWKPEDRDYTLGIAETFLIHVLPMAMLPAEQSSYYLEEFLRNAYETLKESDDPEELSHFAACFVTVMVALADLGLIPPETKIHSVDPYYSDVPDPQNLEEGYTRESQDVAWRADLEPDVYEDHLNWLKWNIDRNSHFLTIFQNELIASGMDLPRIEDHVGHVRTIMAELLRYIGSPMEALPKGLDEALAQGLDVADFMTDPDALRSHVGSLRRFFRVMVKRGYLSEEEGEALLTYLKKQTRLWMERIDAVDEGHISTDAMDSIWF